MDTLTLELKTIKPLHNLAHLEKSLEALPGVETVKIDPDTRTAQISHTNVDLREMLRVIDVQGYDARVRS